MPRLAPRITRRCLLLERMDDEAFDRPEVPMTRQHWQDWLRWTSELDLFERQAASAR